MKRISILVCTVALCLPLILAGCDQGKEERAKLEKQLAQLKTTSGETSSERDRLKMELTAAISKGDGLQEQVSKLTDQESKLRGQISGLNHSSQALEDKVKFLTDSLNDLTGSMKEVVDTSGRLGNEIAELKNAREALQAQVLELTKQRDEAVAKEQQAQRELAVLTAKAQAAGVKPSVPNDGLVAVAETSPKVETPKVETPKVEGAKAPTVHSFASARAKVDKGQSATLTWHVSNASEIHIEPGVGPVSALGSTNVKPTKTTTYTLTAKNDDGQTVETCKVEVR